MTTVPTDFDAAIKTYRDGDWEAAIEKLTALVARVQGSAERYESLEKIGLSYCRLEDYETARNYFEQMLTEEFSTEKKQSARNNLASCYVREGNIPAAKTEFESVVAQGGLAAGHGHYGLACVFSLNKQFDNALDQLQLAMLANSGLKANAESDRDLDPIRPYVRFDEILEIEDAVTKTSNAIVGSLERVIYSTAPVILRAMQSVQRFGSQPVRDWTRNLARKNILRCAQRSAELHGIPTRILSTDSEDANAMGDDVLAQLTEAIELIQRCSPRQYVQLRKNLDSIMILPLPSESGLFVREYRECQLNRTLFAKSEMNRESSIREIACVLIHEACHARVHAIVRQRSSDPEFREERLCRKEEKRFIEKAKSDSKMPWPADYDVEYHERFGYWKRWYYQQHGRQEPTRRFTAIMHVLRTGETEGQAQFLEHIWSMPEHFREYANDLTASLDPNSPDASAWLSRGYDRFNIRQYELAIEDFQQACRLDASNASNWNWLALAAGNAKRNDIAIIAWGKVVELEPNNDEALEWLIVCRRGNYETDPSDLLGLAVRVVQLRPFCHSAMIVKARVLHACGRLDESFELVEQALVYHLDCKEGLLLAETLAEELGLVEQSQNYYDAYLQRIRKDIGEFQSSVECEAIVLERGEDKDSVRMKVLYSPTNEDADLTDLAHRLLQKMNRGPETFDAPYLKALLTVGSHCSSPIELPRGVLLACIADEERILIRDIIIPRRCFQESAVPGALKAIPLYCDRANDECARYDATLLVDSLDSERMLVVANN